MTQILLQTTVADNNYLPFLKPLLRGHTIHINNSTPSTLFEITQKAKSKNIRGVATTNARILQKLLGKHGEKMPSLNDYAGSIIEHNEVEFLILNPLEHAITVPYGKMLIDRYFSKLTFPERWFATSPFEWEIANATSLPALYERFKSADLIAIDIETVKENLAITVCGYCAVWFGPDGNTFKTHSIVLPIDSMYNVAWMRKLNLLPAPKIFQNGKYDNAYFLRYNAPVHNWLFDTLNMFHCWYSELPKRLDFISSFLLRKFQYWKDESVAFNLHDYYQYNAKDTWATANVFIAGMAEWPRYARENYLQEFPLNFPCFLAESTGIKCDSKKKEELKAQLEVKLVGDLKKIQTMVATPAFNPGSWQQTEKLFHVLGCKDIKGTGKIARDKASARHPLNKRILKTIGTYREDRKLLGSYFKDGIAHGGRIIYKLDPTGTDTFRLASAEHHFWCGLQIQNIPRNKKESASVKSMFIADNNFHFGEGDFEQAETRDTAYLSGDTNMLAAVDSDRDFHAGNIERFFGVPYEKVIAADGEILDRELRDFAKRVNHGANYNMSEGVLLDTMGIENVQRARALLKLPPFWTLLQVCKYLLEVFDKTFPVVRSQKAGGYYAFIIECVEKTRMLVGPTQLSRYCFGDPRKSKRDMNVYAAHPSQCLNAATLNKAWLNVFYNIYLHNPSNFKLCAQIHDSILFQYRIGHEYLVEAVKQNMEMTINVSDCHGVTRPLRVPVAMKAGAERWSDIKKYKNVDLDLLKAETQQLARTAGV